MRTETRVVVVEDHPMLREGVKTAVESHDGFTVVGEAATRATILPVLKETHPDVLVLDLVLPDGDSHLVIGEAKREQPNLKVIVLSMHCEIEFIRAAFEAGADGYVSKSSVSDRLLVALEVVQTGELYTDGAVSQSLLEHVVTGSRDAQPPTDERYGRLTAREQEVFGLIAEGLSTKEIACELSVSPKTVETHRASVFLKLEVSDPVELARYAIRIGLIDPAKW